MSVEVGRVCLDEPHDRLQTKTKHYNMIFRGSQRQFSENSEDELRTQKVEMAPLSSWNQKTNMDLRPAC